MHCPLSNSTKLHLEVIKIVGHQRLRQGLKDSQEPSLVHRSGAKAHTSALRGEPRRRHPQQPPSVHVVSRWPPPLSDLTPLSETASKIVD